jgi:hypothetical protein
MTQDQALLIVTSFLPYEFQDEIAQGQETAVGLEKKLPFTVKDGSLLNELYIRFNNSMGAGRYEMEDIVPVLSLALQELVANFNNPGV